MSRCFYREMLSKNVTFLREGLFDNLINLYGLKVNTRLSTEYAKFERLSLKSREISLAAILGLICALFEVISQFYIAHTYCVTSVHIKEMGSFSLWSDFPEKLIVPFTNKQVRWPKMFFLSWN